MKMLLLKKRGRLPAALSFFDDGLLELQLECELNLP